MRFAALVPAVLVSLAACGPRAGRAADVVADEALDPAPWERAWTPQEPTAWREGVAMDLSRAGDIRGDDYVPFDGAKIELFAVAPDGTVSSSPVGAVATTDKDGKFRVGPGPQDGWIIRLTKPGSAATWIGGGLGLAVRGVVMPPPGASVRIGARPAHDLAGRVADRAGVAIAGAHLLLTGEAYREYTTTGPDGQFAAHTPRGPVVVEVDDPQFDHAESPILVPDTGPAPDVAIVARAATPLSGRVKSRDGKPLAGVAVFCVDDPRRRVRTGDDGGFELVVDRRRRIAAVAGGYGWRSCLPPEAGEVEIVLDPAEGFAGKVVDAEGAPVADARLVGVAFGYGGVLERVLGPRTAADGSFRFSWMPKPWRGATTPARFVAEKRGVGESAITRVGGPGDSGATVVITGVRDVFGRTTRAGGKPVAGADVEAKWGHWDGGVSDEEVGVLGLAESAFARTDTDGRWRVRSVPLRLHAKIRCSVDGVVLERPLEPSAPDAPFDFAFESGKPIAGRVVAPDGKPVEGAINVKAQLLMAQGTEVDRTVAAASDGSFQFDPLPAGDYQLTAWGGGYDMTGGATVKSGDTSVEVRMHRTATLKFRFVFDGGAAPDAPLSLVLEPFGGGAVKYARTVEAGHAQDGLELAGVQPGTWTLHVACDAWRGVIEKLPVADGETPAIDAHLARTLRVAAKLVSADGAPRAATLVVIGPVAPTKGVVVTAISAADGAVDLVGLQPGRWCATVDAPGVAALRVEFDVADGANPPLTLQMPPYGAIVVRVSGDDARDADVVLSDADGKPVNAWADGAAVAMNKFHVDADGVAAMRGVRAGKVEVRVEESASKLLLKAKEVVVAAGHDTVVEVP